MHNSQENDDYTPGSRPSRGEIQRSAIEFLEGASRRSEWVDRAACAWAPPDTMFPDNELGVLTAKALCLECPVRADCLSRGLNDEYGIFGGLTPEERAKLRDPKPQTRRGRSTQYSRETIEAIRRDYAAGGVTQRDLADRYGMSRGHVFNVLNGRRDEAA